MKSPENMSSQPGSPEGLRHHADEDLIALIRDREWEPVGQTAFLEFWRRWENYVARLSNQLRRRPPRGTDPAEFGNMIVSKVLEKLLQGALARYRGNDGGVRSYLRTITLNAATDLRRYCEKRPLEPLDGRVGDEDPPSEDEALSALAYRRHPSRPRLLSWERQTFEDQRSAIVTRTVELIAQGSKRGPRLARVLIAEAQGKSLGRIALENDCSIRTIQRDLKKAREEAREILEKEFGITEIAPLLGEDDDG